MKENLEKGKGGNVKCYYNLKKVNMAEEYYLKTLNFDPAHIKALNSLGILYASIGKYSIAEKWFQQGLSLDPDDQAILHNLGFMRKQRGNLPER